ncbi:cupredoxin domain-containing protein [Streptomyces montanus]|uniref:cupredoxin domain-containing protein n=1 Tax=Streptomyces montanus TaxID=2580423 RepID=UPI001FE782DD|nr:cupredoxin family copper-binding protein [Streptomyces montanus]
MSAARRAVLGVVLALLAPLALLALLSAAPGQASAASHQVLMKGYAFGPSVLTVDVGDTVTWTNQDTAPHDVKTTSGPVSFHSPMLDKGRSWSFTFTKAGSYGYYCTVHPDMTARIVVRAPATSAAPPPTHTHAETSSGHHGTVVSRPPSSPAGEGAAGSKKTKAPKAESPSPGVSVTETAAAAPASSAAAAPAVQPAASVRPLDPLLVLAGIVAGAAVLCLLLVGSRSAARRDEEQPAEP